MNVFMTELLSNPWARTAIHLVIGVVLGLLAAAVAALPFRQLVARRAWPARAAQRMRRPFRLLLATIAAWIGYDTALAAPVRSSAAFGLDRPFTILAITFGAWFAGEAVSFVVDVGLARNRVDVKDNRVARGVRTQVLILRRVAIVAIVVVAAGAALLTFPSARTAGASVLASAGVVSIIAGLAAQTTLGNVIAGMQLAFSGAIRVDDVVVANGEWGRIEQITLTYVVLHVWDDRRLVLPSTYFTTTPFENWTRTSSELMQAIEFDLDWRVDPQAMRHEMHRVLGRTALWDGRVAVLQVTDAVGGFVHVRVLVTAVDAATLFDLRCFVREELVRWLHESNPAALPRTRILPVEDDAAQGAVAPRADDERGSALYTGAVPVRRFEGAGSDSGPVTARQ